MKTWILITLLAIAASSSQATTWETNGSPGDVQAKINRASSGDTVHIPSGTFSWTTGVVLNKGGVTLRGDTVVTNAGCPGTGVCTNTAVVTDGTIILDDVTPRNLAMISTEGAPAGQGVRITGITFRRSVTAYNPPQTRSVKLIVFQSTGTENTQNRIDHCYFNQLNTSEILQVQGWNYGVIDHNVWDCVSGNDSIFITGGMGDTGNIAWTQPSFFGTGKFLFVETNTIRSLSNRDVLAGNTDTAQGARIVYRHNFFHNVLIQDHGTEGSVTRPDRCREMYYNTFEWSYPNNANAQRSGNSLNHDNTWRGVQQANHSVTTPSSYRSNSSRSGSVWGPADGSSPWDLNDNGTGNPAPAGQLGYIFKTGIATSDSIITGGSATMYDATKNWTTNQWAGYSVRNVEPTGQSYKLGSLISSNTATSITYSYYGGTDTARHLTFLTGQHYEIRRCIKSLDMAGTGWGDRITGDPPINQVTGTACAPHWHAEPSVSWNNKGSDGSVYNIVSHVAFIKVGRDYFNYGNGWTGIPPDVLTRYNATVNGVPYTGDYVYPHPR
jgi:hypothetical protein